MTSGSHIASIDAFSKYEACGNDYIVLEPQKLSFELAPGALKLLCSRHVGIGSDGALVRQDAAGARYGVRIFNPDGQEAEFSGNGVRIFARFARDVLGEQSGSFTIGTLSGIVQVAIEATDSGATLVQAGVTHLPAVDRLCAAETLSLSDGERIKGYPVSVGNPHFVVFVERPLKMDLNTLGAGLQHHPRFPSGVNVELVTVKGRDEIALRIWERGVGETLSSGSCALAAAAAAHALGLAGARVTVSMPGGRLEVALGKDRVATLRGPVCEVAHGAIAADLVRKMRAHG